MIKQKKREDLKKYISGTGIEIGALQNPLDLDGLSIKDIKYVDKVDLDELRRHYPELRDVVIKEPDVIDDAQLLENISNDSLDFIIANHLIEHLENPLLAIKNWSERLKTDGIIFLAVPDKQHTFDKDRALTSNQHLQDDYDASIEALKTRNAQHYRAWVKNIQGKSGDLARQEVTRLQDINYSIHYHVWTYKTFRQFLDHLINNHKLPIKIEDYTKTIGNEFIFILKKLEHSWSIL